MKIKDAHMQAFPFIEPASDEAIKAYHPGMTMRDEFAKAALQGLLADPEAFDDLGEGMAMAYAREAYIYADAMMKARE